MALEVTSISEVLATCVTMEDGLLSRLYMGFNMCLQGSGLSKHFSTVVAVVWLLASMLAFMTSQEEAIRELLVTEATLKHLPSVCAQVVTETVFL